MLTLLTASTTSPMSSLALEQPQLLLPTVGEPLRVAWLPDGRTRLVYSSFEGGAHGDLRIAGPQSHAFYKSASRVCWSLVLPFRPGWSFAALGVPPHELRDRFLPLEELWGNVARDLGHELASSSDGAEVHVVLRRLMRLLDARVRAANTFSSARLAREATRLLEQADLRMPEVAGRLGVTPRHLRRVFTESVGVGPKDYARVMRLQRAVRSAAASRNWAHIAAETGYYDQAHLIDDFRSLTGLTPAAYFDERVPRPTGVECVGS